MESTILTNMNKLRIISIICSIISISLLFGLTSIMETEESYTEESRAAEGIERNSTLLPISLIFLFVGPAAISGVIASFFKTVKLQIIVWSVFTLVIWFGIMVLVFFMLTDPTSFGIPEHYWEIDK